MDRASAGQGRHDRVRSRHGGHRLRGDKTAYFDAGNSGGGDRLDHFQALLHAENTRLVLQAIARPDIGNYYLFTHSRQAAYRVTLQITAAFSLAARYLWRATSPRLQSWEWVVPSAWVWGLPGS